MNDNLPTPIPHTPGRWMGDPETLDVIAQNPYGHGHMLIAECVAGWEHLTDADCCNMSEEEAEKIVQANMEFIAAAPETKVQRDMLLAAGIKALAELTSTRSCGQKAEDCVDCHGRAECPVADLHLAVWRATGVAR